MEKHRFPGHKGLYWGKIWWIILILVIIIYRIYKIVLRIQVLRIWIKMPRIWIWKGLKGVNRRLRFWVSSWMIRWSSKGWMMILCFLWGRFKLGFRFWIIRLRMRYWKLWGIIGKRNKKLLWGKGSVLTRKWIKNKENLKIFSN